MVVVDAEHEAHVVEASSLWACDDDRRRPARCRACTRSSRSVAAESSRDRRRPGRRGVASPPCRVPRLEANTGPRELISARMGGTRQMILELVSVDARGASGFAGLAAEPASGSWRRFLELFPPRPRRRAVVDVGVTDAPFGEPARATTSSRRSTGGPSAAPLIRAHRARPVRGGVPGRERRPGRRPRIAVRRWSVRARLLERRRGARRRRAEGPAPVRPRALPRGAARVGTTPNRLVPARAAHAAAVRPLAAARAARDRMLRARGFDDVLDPLGPRELAAFFPYPVRVISRGMTLVAVGADAGAEDTAPRRSGRCTCWSSDSRSTTS